MNFKLFEKRKKKGKKNSKSFINIYIIIKLLY